MRIFPDFKAENQKIIDRGQNPKVIWPLAILFAFTVIFFGAKYLGIIDVINPKSEEQKIVERQSQLDKARKEHESKLEEDAKSARLIAFSLAQHALVGSLRDPDSVQWKWKAINLDNGAFCYLYRAKNGFGGYAEDGTVIYKEKAYQSAEKWKKLCNENANYEVY